MKWCPPKTGGHHAASRRDRGGVLARRLPYFEEIRHLTVSAHFLIERDGAITQFVSCHDRAWHAGVSCFDGREACNDFSLGIELEGTDTEPYTDAQYTALAGLTRLLRAAFPGITPERIQGHCDIAPERKTDPGEAFDWSRYRAGLTDSKEET
nr:1,6-anhydro-N-acetylmuramyl-L-alanine amidase AmpD [Pseudomonas aeruginosa]